MIALTVNGQPRAARSDPEKPLLWVLRDELGLKGAKYGCGIGLCGTCLVLIDGEPNHSCMVPLRKAAGRHITTIEGLAAKNPALTQAWIAEQVPQCGYCQGGQLIAAAALLEKNPQPTRAEVDAALSGVLCRCGTYPRIRRAIERAVREPAETAPLPGTPPPPAGEAIALNDFIAILPDNRVRVMINHSEMGQGALTGLCLLVAEELEVELSAITTAFAPADPRYRNPLWGAQFTGGSSSVRGEWEPLRRTAAGARERLIAAAAQQWQVEASECRAHEGRVVHERSGRALSYAGLAASAARLPAPGNVRLKEAGEFRRIGRAQARLDIPDMVAGRTVYGIDVAPPGMLVASVVRCPVFGGHLKRFDDRNARKVPGVRAVLAIASGVAVVAEDFWSALRGREALEVEWDLGAHADLAHEAIYAQLHAAARRKGKTARKDGNVERALKGAARTLEADYATPCLAHACLEPMNCTAQVRDGVCDVWVGTQSQVDTQKTAAGVAGVARSRVRVHTQFLGGGFGRRLETDFVADAVELAKRLEQPVQVIWTRADDLQHDLYRPAGHAHLTAGLDQDGWPVAWHMRLAGSELVLEGVHLHYAIANVREEHIEVQSAVPTGAWRSVGASQNAFAIECFVDELAHATGRDPLEYRRALLESAPRLRGVLERAAAMAGWGRALPAGHGLGIACYRSYGSFVAMTAEVAIAEDRMRVPRVWAAIDCGIAVNPDAVRAQVEGAIAFGLSAALKEEIRIERGRVAQATFEDYPILTLAGMPEVEVHIMESMEAPGGVGEPGVPVIAPAVANAVFAASGIRLRALPLRISRTTTRA
jgi:isoquinoline 1-oxidoreductase beta subunit